MKASDGNLAESILAQVQESKRTEAVESTRRDAREPIATQRKRLKGSSEKAHQFSTI